MVIAVVNLWKLVLVVYPFNNVITAILIVPTWYHPQINSPLVYPLILILTTLTHLVLYPLSLVTIVTIFFIANLVHVSFPHLSLQLKSILLLGQIPAKITNVVDLEILEHYPRVVAHPIINLFNLIIHLSLTQRLILLVIIVVSPHNTNPLDLKDHHQFR